MLVKAWTEERFSHKGEFWQFEDVAVVPKPVQKPHPKLYTGGTSDITYQMAGERDWGICVPPLLPWDLLEGPLDIYKEACAKAGNTPDILYLRPVYLGDDEKQIRREVEEAVHNFLKFNASPIFSKPPLPPKEELIAKGYGFYASGALEGLTELSYDDIVEVFSDARGSRFAVVGAEVFFWFDAPTMITIDGSDSTLITCSSVRDARSSANRASRPPSTKAYPFIIPSRLAR